MSMSISETYRAMFPPKPYFTEKHVPDLTGKVYLITGANTGLGYELARLLHARNATVHLACRSIPSAESAIAAISEANPSSRGALHAVHLDLSDLASVQRAALAFLASADRLDALFHNAGLLAPPAGSVTAQGTELVFGVHVTGPFLLTALLEPLLRRTAKSSSAAGARNDVRIVWVGSMGTILSPPGGVDVSKLDSGNTGTGPIERYNFSKAGAYFASAYFARKLADDGIVSVHLDPGNLKTNLQRNFADEVSRVGMHILNLFLHPPVKGAYTELYAGLSPDVTIETVKGGANWVQPFGRLGPIRKDLFEQVEIGESGNMMGLVHWIENKIKPYVS